MSNDEELGRGSFDSAAALSEFSDLRLFPPTTASLETINELGRQLIAQATPIFMRELALFNGGVGYTPDREEGDIMHIVQRLNDASSPFPEITWYRGSFQDILDTYFLQNGVVGTHANFALTMTKRYGRSPRRSIRTGYSAFSRTRSRDRSKVSTRANNRATGTADWPKRYAT